MKYTDQQIAESKNCSSCGESKPITAFSKNGKYLETRCKVCRVGHHMQWRKDNPDYRRNYELIRRYGITLEQFKNKLAAQGGKCAICGSTESGKQDWHLDHDHETKQNRGILCPKCNRALGYFNDDVTVLEKAAKYLRKYNCPLQIAI